MVDRQQVESAGSRCEEKNEDRAGRKTRNGEAPVQGKIRLDKRRS